MSDMQLPADFEPSGLLPPGAYVATLAQLRDSLFVKGSASTGSSWDGGWRRHLVDQLELLASDLWSVGIERLFIDGSFCTEKPRPGDIDGYFVTAFPDWPAQHARLRASRSVWTWSPQDLVCGPDGKPKLPLWHAHRVELFPVFDPPFRHYSSRGTQTEVIDKFFCHTRSGESKGIVKIVKEPAP
jgi:hypothetical protein